MKTIGTLAVIAFLSATPAHSAPESKAKTRSFSVGGSKLIGKDTAVCFIEGSWADGSPFVYQAWDRCSALNIRPVSGDAFRDAQNLGRDKTAPEAAAPLEAFQISNAHSRIYIYKDRRGHLQERLVGD